MSATDNIEVLEYRISQLEEMLKPLLKLVGSLETKIALLAQKMLIATVGLGLILNGLGVWYNTNASKEYTEPEKKTYYENRIGESDKIKDLEIQIEKLKRGIK